MPHLKKHCYVKCSEIRYSDLQQSWDLDASSRDIFYSHDLEYQTCILIHMMLINTYSDTSILIHVMNSVISIFWFLPECPHCTSLLSVAWQPQVRILSVQQLSRFCSSYPSSSTLALAFIIQTLPFLIYE